MTQVGIHDTPPSQNQWIIDQHAKMRKIADEIEARIGTLNSGEAGVCDIGWAVKQLRNGSKVRRAGWNGKGMFLLLVPGTTLASLKAGTPYAEALPRHFAITIDPHVDMYTSKDTMQPGWLCSQADLLATDWEIAA